LFYVLACPHNKIESPNRLLSPSKTSHARSGSYFIPNPFSKTSAGEPERLLFGSDWPVLTLAGGYKTWMDTFRSFIAELSAEEQESMRGGAAIAAYRL
jgi:predicted TIM-barrel fold metal-dependent hydrolase